GANSLGTGRAVMDAGPPGWLARATCWAAPPPVDPATTPDGAGADVCVSAGCLAHPATRTTTSTASSTSRCLIIACPPATPAGAVCHDALTSRSVAVMT